MIDICIVVLYLAVLLGIGIWQRQKSQDFADFARVKDNIKQGRFILVATIFASSIGGGTTFGISEKAFAGNVAHSYGLFISIITDLLIAAFIVPRLIKQHYGCETPADIMQHYYGKIGKYITGIATILVSMGLLAAQISVSGRIFEYILQVDFVQGVLISYGIVIVYSTIGGFRSVLLTNGLQFLAILIAIPIITIFGIYQIGFSEFLYKIPSSKISFVSSPSLIADTIGITLGFCVMNLFPTFIQRALMNREIKRTQTAIYIKSFIYSIFIVFITLNGIIAYIIFPDLKARFALPVLIDTIIPTGIQGIVIAGMLATVMSTADSDLNITSISIVKDFLKPVWNVTNQKRLLLMARVVNVVLGSFAIYLALNFSSIVDLVIFVAGFWGPVVLVPMVFGLFGIIITPLQMLISSLAGAVSFAVWELSICITSKINLFGFNMICLKGVFVGTIIHLILFLIFYYFNQGNYKRMST